MELTQLAEYGIVNEVPARNIGIVSNGRADHSYPSARHLPRAADQHGRFAKTFARHRAIGANSCHVGVVARVEDLPREVLGVPISKASRDQQPALPFNRHGSHRGEHLQTRQLWLSPSLSPVGRAILDPRQNRHVVFRIRL